MVSNMEVYLDNSATTLIGENALNIMIKVMKEDYGNPSSMHLMGVKAERYMRDATDIIARALKVEPKEIVFTSGGTEANNLALIGTALANRRKGKHIITTTIEHPSVQQPLYFLEENGYEVSYAPIDETGMIIKESLYELVTSETLLVSLMYVNNEIGSVQDIEEIAKELKRIKEDIIIHVDAVQAFGKYTIHPKRMGIDLLTFSGHKIHGPKGSGVLYINDKVRVKPLLLGGGHQRGVRSGTENVAAIAGIGQAVADLYTDFDKKISRMYELKQRFLKGVIKFKDVKVNGLPKECSNNMEMEQIRKTAPHIISVSFKGIRSEVLLHALEEKGIYVSSGSACSSNHPQPSATLKAIGLPKDLIDSTLRFSMSHLTTSEDIDYTLEKLGELLPVLRRYRRK